MLLQIASKINLCFTLNLAAFKREGILNETIVLHFWFKKFIGFHSPF
jgi:hypothetical protein